MHVSPLSAQGVFCLLPLFLKRLIFLKLCPKRCTLYEVFSSDRASMLERKEMRARNPSMRDHDLWTWRGFARVWSEKRLNKSRLQTNQTEIVKQK